MKAFANEHGIKLISVSAGKLTVEPFALTKAQASSLRRKAGRYLADKKKMVAPLRVVVPGYGKEGEASDAGMLTNVFAYLQKLSAEAKESAAAKPAAAASTARSTAGSRGSSATAGASAARTVSSSSGSKTSRSGNAKTRARSASTRSSRAASLGVTNYLGRKTGPATRRGAKR